ncbi:hypothetical protein NQZ68_022466 [Dissostichus eleginoides]|nr:hypothetical protein NQZ68_022466 [Dissostichus eleginoides]
MGLVFGLLWLFTGFLQGVHGQGVYDSVPLQVYMSLGLGMFERLGVSAGLYVSRTRSTCLWDSVCLRDPVSLQVYMSLGLGMFEGLGVSAGLHVSRTVCPSNG